MLYPMSLMVLLTFLVGVIAMMTRFMNLRSGQVRIGYFKLMQGQDAPDESHCDNSMFQQHVRGPSALLCRRRPFRQFGRRESLCAGPRVAFCRVSISPGFHSPDSQSFAPKNVVILDVIYMCFSVVDQSHLPEQIDRAYIWRNDWYCRQTIETPSSRPTKTVERSREQVLTDSD